MAIVNNANAGDVVLQAIWAKRTWRAIAEVLQLSQSV